ncbi:MAG TPA: GNAT family N-acetyltransferase [Microvirga sp.]
MDRSPIPPILATERLVLRPHGADDFEASFALWSDPRTVRYISGKPTTRDEAWSRLLRYAGLWSLLGYGYWAIEERATGAFAGEVGFADFKRAMVPSLEGVPEAGWVLAPAVHGRGYATEAVEAALAWGDRHLAVPETACIVTPENTPSIRVAEKCGYREQARTTFKESEVVLMRRSARGANAHWPAA